MSQPIQRIGIIGTGLMGQGIAQSCAQAGLDVVLVRATGGDCSAARSRLASAYAKAVERKRLSEGEADAALARIQFTGQLDDIAACDLVIEAIIEDRDAKADLFERLESLARPDAIFASNTSTLRCSELAAKRPVCALHFFSPVPAMKLVEVAADDKLAPPLLGFVKRLGKTAVRVPDSTGFIVNRLLVPMLLGAIAAHEQGLGSANDIDTAMRLGCNHPVGPLALCDLIGLDIVYHMAKLLYADFGDARFRPPALLRKMVQAGHLGKKTGRGFYAYQNGQASEQPAFDFGKRKSHSNRHAA